MSSQQDKPGPQAKGPRRATREVRREQIAEAALAVVAEGGVGAMTVERVAKVVGLAPSGLYRHFSGRDEILDAVLELIRQRLMTNLDDARRLGRDPLDALRVLLLRIVAIIGQLRALPRVLFSDEVYGDPSGRRSRMALVLEEFLAGLESLAAEGQVVEVIRPELNPRDVAVLFIGLYTPLAVLTHAGGFPMDLLAQAQASWEIFERGVRP